MATSVLDHWSDTILTVRDDPSTAKIFKAMTDQNSVSWSSPRSHWGDCIDKLLEIRNWKADWDGEGAVAPDSKAVDLAIRFTMAFQKRNGPLPAQIAPTSDGTIAIEWQGDGGRVIAQIEAIDGRTIEYFEMHDSNVVQHYRCDYEVSK